VSDDIVYEEDNREYEKGDKFLSFHRQAGRLMSRKALLAGYLSAWLKKRDSISSSDGIMPLAIFSAV